MAGDRRAGARAGEGAGPAGACRRRPTSGGDRLSILGFDTSTAATSACLLRADGRTFELLPDVAALAAPPSHARDLLPAVAGVMERSGLDWPGLESIAVGRGPGTFTGLRIGLATARALAEAHALPLRTVSSLAALAAGIDAPLRLALIDARRGEVFGALYAGADERWAPFVARPEAVAERAAELSERPLAAGDGSLRFRDVLEAAGIPVAAEESPMHLVRALHVCRLAAQAPPLPAEAALPDYLREPDVTMKPAT